MQLAIWASGIDGTAEGTVQWGGGMVDWEADDYTSNGYYWAELKSITLECADEGLNTTHGYVYTGLDGSNVPVSFSISPTFSPARLLQAVVSCCHMKRRATCLTRSYGVGVVDSSGAAVSIMSYEPPNEGTAP